MDSKPQKALTVFGELHKHLLSKMKWIERTTQEREESDLPDKPENQDASLVPRPSGAYAPTDTKQSGMDQAANASPKLATAYNGAGIFADLE